MGDENKRGEEGGGGTVQGLINTVPKLEDSFLECRKALLATEAVDE